MNSYQTKMLERINILKLKEDVNILAIESSCDETSASVVKNGRTILSNVISSQVELHKVFGGVVPEIASRKHTEIINDLIDQALGDAGLDFSGIDAIGVTYTPGLVGALLVGISTAKALAYALSLPLIGVNHIEGHICANFLIYPDLRPPFLCLVVSGGHTHLIWVNDYLKFQIIGQTKDDAVGEAFDKVARILRLGYPGGAEIDRLAKTNVNQKVFFPRACIDEDSFDFSYSGLKTAVLNHINKLKQKNAVVDVALISDSFQSAAIDVLKTKVLKAMNFKNTDVIVLAGGVAANSALRRELSDLSDSNNYKLYVPPIELCTDNAAMIGSAAYFRLRAGLISGLTLNANTENIMLTD